MEAYPFGQGKWYPGVISSLAMHYIGKDGLPLWKKCFVAKEGDTKFTFHDAEKFATELTNI
jgi:uncharacterized protein (DUF2126 family)